MARRHRLNLNSNYKLDKSRVNSWLASIGKDHIWLAGKIDKTPVTTKDMLHNALIPKKPVLDKLAGLMETAPESLLLKHVT